MREIHPGLLWTIEESLSMSGLEIGARLLVARLGDGLLVHAPFAIDDAQAAAIRALGEVQIIFVPNNFHYKEVGEFARRFPSAPVWAPPQLASKLKNVPHQSLGEFPAALCDDFDALRFDCPVFHEWALCHRASRTLILTDLAVNLPRPHAPLARVVSRLADVGRGFKPTRLERAMLCTGSRANSKKNLETVLSWDFERVSIAHGAILESGGKTALRRAYAWLLD